MTSVNTKKTADSVEWNEWGRLNWAKWVRATIVSPDLRYERVYRPLCKVYDTPFHIQRDDNYVRMSNKSHSKESIDYHDYSTTCQLTKTALCIRQTLVFGRRQMRQADADDRRRRSYSRFRLWNLESYEVFLKLLYQLYAQGRLTLHH